MPRIFFDVGANDGSSMFHHTNDPNNIVYAFEPTRELAAKLRARFAFHNNYIVIPKAVADYTGQSTFYISGQADWGCSSLNHFADSLHQTWPGRTDFKVTDSYEVDVIKLEDFVIENNITEIEYLHVDVQGKDLEVLMGLGSKLSIVKAGVIEMPTSHEKKLYKDQKYLKEDAVKFLEENNFRVTGISSNDCFNNECNISFVRL